MEVEKEQQAQARRKPAALYLPHCGQSSHVSTSGRRHITGPTADNIGRAPLTMEVEHRGSAHLSMSR
jgi:hypothetical protein